MLKLLYLESIRKASLNISPPINKMFHVKLYSTNDKHHQVNIKEAVLKSLPHDNGLYMPSKIPRISDEFLQNISNLSFHEIATYISKLYLGKDIEESDLKEMISNAINFPAPVITIDKNLSILELFHGPTLAFKDFGARFMARLMNYFWKEKTQKLRILVATSGDTGGAVAAGFHGLDNIEVIILYPKGKVSKLQEKQLTTWGDNIKAIEIDGDFDDCQRMVKQAFLDKNLNSDLNLSSANSINIGRLLPQTFYYFEAYKQLNSNKELVFSVPSGNFGNLTAGLLAKKMGLPISHMVAATNINDVIPKYIATGEYLPKNSKETLSNAMDIGNPSNFARILDLYGSTWNHIKKDITAYSFTDSQTTDKIVSTHKNLGYVLDPHTAVGVLGAMKYKKQNPNAHTVVLSTAHPIKFQSEIQEYIDFSIPYPSTVQNFLEKEGIKTPMKPKFTDFKIYLKSLE